MRTGRPRSARVQWHAPWGQRFPSALGSAGFQVILQGSCWLTPPDGGAPIALGIGDVVFFPHGHGYGLADSPATSLAEPDCDPLEEAALPPSPPTAPPLPGPPAVPLCGGPHPAPARPHPLRDALPNRPPLPPRLGPRAKTPAPAPLPGSELARPRLGTDTIVP